MVIRGAFTPAPMTDDPVMKIPHAAPTTENPIHETIPRLAHMYGDTDSRNAPTLNASPDPLNNMSILHRKTKKKHC